MNCGVITDWPAKIAGLVPVSPLMYLAARSAGGSDQLHAATGQLQTLPACSCGQLARLGSSRLASEESASRSGKIGRKEDSWMFSCSEHCWHLAWWCLPLVDFFLSFFATSSSVLSGLVHPSSFSFMQFVRGKFFFCVCVDTVCLDLLKLETGYRTFRTSGNWR